MINKIKESPGYQMSRLCANNYGHSCVFRISKHNICMLIGYIQEQHNIDMLRLVQDYICQTIHEADIVRGLPVEFSATLAAHMKSAGVTTKILSDTSLVSERTIQRMRQNERYTVSLCTVIAICIGLKLPPLLSFDLLRKGGYSFKRTLEHVGYSGILASHYQCSIYECNELCKAAGIPLFANKVFF